MYRLVDLHTICHFDVKFIRLRQLQNITKATLELHYTVFLFNHIRYLTRGTSVNFEFPTILKHVSISLQIIIELIRTEISENFKAVYTFLFS